MIQKTLYLMVTSGLVAIGFHGWGVRASHAPQITAPSPQDKPIDSNDDIVVTARKLEDISGYWEFLETGIYRSQEAGQQTSSRSWKMCIKRQMFRFGLQRVLGPTNAASTRMNVPDDCYRWSISSDNGHVVARQQCFVGRLRLTGSAEGTFDDNRLSITKVRSTIGGGTRASGIYKIEGRRLSAC